MLRASHQTHSSFCKATFATTIPGHSALTSRLSLSGPSIPTQRRLSHCYAQFYEQNFNVARCGLIASPHRKLVVQAMEKELVDPRHSVDFNFPAEPAFIAAEVQRPELFGAGDKAWWSPEWEHASKRRNEVSTGWIHSKTTVGLTSEARGPAETHLSAGLMILARWDLPGKAQLRKQAAEEAARLMPKMKEAPILWEEEWKVVASPALLPANCYFAHNSLEFPSC
jgi:hypothetical protein